MHFIFIANVVVGVDGTRRTRRTYLAKKNNSYFISTCPFLPLPKRAPAPAARSTRLRSRSFADCVLRLLVDCFGRRPLEGRVPLVDGRVCSVSYIITDLIARYSVGGGR
ncbi:unnamed protein product [Laminaria digitata]